MEDLPSLTLSDWRQGSAIWSVDLEAYGLLCSSRREYGQLERLPPGTAATEIMEFELYLLLPAIKTAAQSDIAAQKAPFLAIEAQVLAITLDKFVILRAGTDEGVLVGHEFHVRGKTTVQVIHTAPQWSCAQVILGKRQYVSRNALATTRRSR